MKGGVHEEQWKSRADILTLNYFRIESQTLEIDSAIQVT